jgi:hypothetical protein
VAITRRRPVENPVEAAEQYPQRLIQGPGNQIRLRAVQEVCDDLLVRRRASCRRPDSCFASLLTLLFATLSGRESKDTLLGLIGALPDTCRHG